ncbi:MAG: glycosyltransferase family 4 protein [Candidatus Omnitrophota bacterium]
MKKIKIAQVITRMDWGGSPDIVRILSQYLDKDRFDLRFICGPSAFLTEKTQVFFDAIKANRIQVNSLRRNINPIFDFLAFWELYFIFRKHKFDIVHTHTAKAGALGRVAAFLAKVKVIIHTSHGHNFYGYFNLWFSNLIVVIERFLSKLTTQIITLTEIEKIDLAKFRICSPDKIKVVNTVMEMPEVQIETAIRDKLMIKPGEIVIGMVGRLEPIKGVEYFIQAAMEVAQNFSQTRFVLVGEGSLRGLLEQKVKENKLINRFTFTGWQENPMHYMHAMDLMVLASLNEAVGLVLIEAQSLGVPVIATKVGGVPEIVEHGKSGILVNPSDRKALIDAIEMLIKNPAQRLAMGQYAKKNVLAKYSVEVFIARITQIYEDLIQETTERKD